MSGGRPDLVLKDFPVECAIWKREKDGNAWYSINVSKSYKDDDGVWQSTNYLNGRDLLAAAALLQDAHRRLVIEERKP